MNITREKLQEKLHISDTTLRCWCRGYYFRKGKPIWFFPDHHTLDPIQGSGKKSFPYLYSIPQAQKYQKEIKLK